MPTCMKVNLKLLNLHVSAMCFQRASKGLQKGNLWIEECRGENSTMRFKFFQHQFLFQEVIRSQKLQLIDHHKFIMKFAQAHLLNLN